jgi:hypothetical protein
MTSSSCLRALRPVGNVNVCRCFLRTARLRVLREGSERRRALRDEAPRQLELPRLARLPGRATRGHRNMDRRSGASGSGPASDCEANRHQEAALRRYSYAPRWRCGSVINP